MISSFKSKNFPYKFRKKFSHQFNAAYSSQTELSSTNTQGLNLSSENFVSLSKEETNSFRKDFNRTIRFKGLERFKRAATIASKSNRSRSLGLIQESRLAKLVEQLPKLYDLKKSTSKVSLNGKFKL